MSNFQIDFFELSFLAEACIPPRPIARSMFWKNLTDVYWHQMTDRERDLLFEWINRNGYYEQSLKDNEDTQIFHARFNPDNQYTIETKHKRKKETHRAFKYKDRYWVGTRSFISPEFISGVKKLEIIIEENI